MIDATQTQRLWSHMNYRNSEMKIDQIISYLNENKINLSPVFQRGHVWKVSTRKKLMRNIVLGRPIPAIFLYKEAAGSRYSYNILDGKQRLESVILFVARLRTEISIPEWHKYFFGPTTQQQAGFSVELPGEGEKTFAELDESIVRDFREYAIPTIEISLTDDSSLDEIINLFVDINQEGVAVSRFAVVKAMWKKNGLLSSTFSLIAEKQERGHDVFYRSKKNEFTKVLLRLKTVSSSSDANSRVDRMWERMLEFVLFAQTKQHRPPTEILKGFITESGTVPMVRPSSAQVSELRRIFKFIERAYKESPTLGDSLLAVNQVHFYTMATSLMETNLLNQFTQQDLTSRLEKLAGYMDRPETIPDDKHLKTNVKSYLAESQTQTTHVGRRAKRQKNFLEAVRAISPTSII